MYCYMRSSLLWKYPVESVLLAGHYVRERVRQRIRSIVAPRAAASAARARRAGAPFASARRPRRIVGEPPGFASVAVDAASTEVDSVSVAVDAASTEVDSVSVAVDAASTEVDSVSTAVDAASTEVDSVSTAVDVASLVGG